MAQLDRFPLKVTEDADHADDPQRADVKEHQEDHDSVHYALDLFDWSGFGTWPDGAVWFWNDGLQQWQPIDPGISGSPGPAGASLRFVGAWSSITAYVNNSSFIDVVSYHGQMWVCVASNTNSTPASNNTNWKVGAAGFWPTGTWSSSTTYDPNDVVSYQGNTYFALARHSNSQPPSANWQLMASAGAAGSDGQSIVGPSGADGPPGPVEETLSGPAHYASGTILIDPGQATFYQIILDGDCDVTLSDSTGEVITKVVVEVIQGTGSPNVLTYNTGITWFTSDGLPPTLSTGAGVFNVLVFYQVNGQWRGFTPGVTGTPAPITYSTLDVEDFGSWFDSTDHAAPPANYASVSTFQLGNQRGGGLWVEIERGDSVDPAIPSLLDGSGGASHWTEAASVVHGTGTTRRRLTLFLARDDVTGPAAPITVVPGAGDAAATIIGVHCMGLRTKVNVPPGWLTTAISKAVAAAFTGDQLHCSITLASPAAASSRAIMCVAGNNAATLTPTDFTVILEETNSPGNPIMHLWTGWTPSSFVTVPDGTFSINVNWAMVGTEMIQG